MELQGIKRFNQISPGDPGKEHTDPSSVQRPYLGTVALEV